MASELDLSARVRNHIEQSISVKSMLLSDSAFMAQLVEISSCCIDALENGNKMLFAGNGGSAADAQHIAAEFVSRFEFDRPGLSAFSLSTDTSVITAIANDYGYHNLFSRQIESNGVEGDIFFGITTSGRSENIIKAFESASSKGLITVGLTGSHGSDRLTQCDYVISVPSNDTALIQESHIMTGHIICGLVESVVFGDRI